MLASVVFAFHACWSLTDSNVLSETAHDSDADNAVDVTVATYNGLMILCVKG